MILGILEGIRRVVLRWTNTKSPLISDISSGDDIISVYSTRRFCRGDEIMINNATVGETRLYIKEILDCQRLQLTSGVNNNWAASGSVYVQKTFGQKLVQRAYLGEPSVIPKLPAISISASSRESSWYTIDSTKERYNVSINVYFEDGNQETAYVGLLKLVDTIQFGLKQNIYLPTYPVTTIPITVSANTGDVFLNVRDSSQIFYPSRIQLENAWDYEELFITNAISSTVVQLQYPLVQSFPLSSGPIINIFDSFIYNSWPANITYGKIFKGTMLKSASIEWFAEEMLDATSPPGEPFIK